MIGKVICRNLQDTLRPRDFRWALHFACNDHGNGMCQGFVEEVRIGLGRGNFEFGTDFLDEHYLELHGPRTKFHWENDSEFRFLRKTWLCRGIKTWVGNWCWNACFVERRTVRQILNRLKRRNWRPENGTTLMFDYFEDKCGKLSPLNRSNKPMSEHTPEPWSTGGIFNPDSDRPTQNIWGPRGNNQSGVLIAKDATIADAKRIVLAVNCHDELLAACKAALNNLNEVHGHERQWACEQLESAIAKASV